MREAIHAGYLHIEDPTIHNIADRHGAGPAQILIAWSLERGTAVVPKSVNPKRIRENFEAAKLALTGTEMGDMARLDRHHRYVNGSFWCPPGSGYTMNTLWDE